MSIDNSNILDTTKWGQNLLGKALMEAREDIRTVERAFGDINKLDPEDLVYSGELVFEAEEKLKEGK